MAEEVQRDSMRRLSLKSKQDLRAFHEADMKYWTDGLRLAPPEEKPEIEAHIAECSTILARLDAELHQYRINKLERNIAKTRRLHRAEAEGLDDDAKPAFYGSLAKRGEYMKKQAFCDVLGVDIADYKRWQREDKRPCPAPDVKKIEAKIDSLPD
jgi:hypothetical protein